MPVAALKPSLSPQICIPFLLHFMSLQILEDILGKCINLAWLTWRQGSGTTERQTGGEDGGLLKKKEGVKWRIEGQICRVSICGYNPKTPVERAVWERRGGDEFKTPVVKFSFHFLKCTQENTQGFFYQTHCGHVILQVWDDYVDVLLSCFLEHKAKASFSLVNNGATWNGIKSIRDSMTKTRIYL